MKIYLISGLGADYKVLEKLEFDKKFEVEFLDWLIPLKKESFQGYVQRMLAKIDNAKPFVLIGYSFGGIIVQEIHKIIPAEKVIILGSIKSDKEKSNFIKFGQFTKLSKVLPEKFFNEKNIERYSIVRKIFDSKNPKILEFFTVRNAYYLKWSIEKIAEWKHQENKDVIQILADKDIVFPIKNSKPEYIIKGGTHLFPLTKAKEVSGILKEILSTL
jgi:hypothetical protein